MRADWTGSGACTSGSTAPPRGATRRSSRASGGAATTSTAASDAAEGCATDLPSGDHFRHASQGAKDELPMRKITANSPQDWVRYHEYGSPYSAPWARAAAQDAATTQNESESCC